MIRKDAFDEVGGFDTDYFAHQEEIDLAWRLLLKGYKILCCPQSKVYHVGGGTLTYNSPRKIYLNFRNNLVTLFKYLPGIDFIPIVSLRWLLDGLAGIRFISKGEFANAWAIARSHFYIYSHLRLVLTKRRKSAEAYNRIQLSKLPGVFQGSIILEYYGRWKRKWNQLFHP